MLEKIVQNLVCLSNVLDKIIFYDTALTRFKFKLYFILVVNR